MVERFNSLWSKILKLKMVLELTNKRRKNLYLMTSLTLEFLAKMNLSLKSKKESLFQKFTSLTFKTHGTWLWKQKASTPKDLELSYSKTFSNLTQKAKRLSILNYKVFQVMLFIRTNSFLIMPNQLLILLALLFKTAETSKVLLFLFSTS